MMQSLLDHFSTSGFMPHGMCIAWTPSLLWTMVGADVAIALAYYSIPVALVLATRHHKVATYRGMFLMFSAFIFACGTTHLIDVLTVWYPQYWLDAGAKVATAGVSLAAAAMLWPAVASAADYMERHELATAELYDKTELLKDLRARNRDLNNFAYLASHDLQEPLRTVATASTLIRDRYADRLDEVGTQSLELMNRAVDRMGDMINDLLDHSRLGTSAEVEPVPMDEILNELRDDLSSTIAEAGATIEAGAMPTVLGRRSELYALLQNLLTNALKFRRPGVAPSIQVAADRVKEGWRFSVSDNGIGIAPEHQERVFQIFQRLHNRRDYEGTGIGLAHCQKIVEGHGGRIWLESTPGEGSTFYFILPGDAS